MSAPGAEPLVLPLGHPMGPFHSHRDTPPSYWVVRLGWDSPLLPDRDTAEVWQLAHGLPDQVHATPWTRTALRGAARAAGVADPDAVLDQLIGRGLVAELVPGTAAAAWAASASGVQGRATWSAGPWDMAQTPNSAEVRLCSAAPTRTSNWSTTARTPISWPIG